MRVRTTKTIVLKDAATICTGALVWWAFGYPFALGNGKEDSFIGSGDFFSYRNDYEAGFFSKWLFQWTFAAVAAAIVSGAVAERCRFSAYLVYTVVLTGLIYPVVVHWAWSDGGWLSSKDEDYLEDRSGKFLNPEMGANGLIDFAGSGVVHMVGGGVALMGAVTLGPRLGRFDRDGRPTDAEGHSSVLALMGTLMLWFGWYGMAPVSTWRWGAMQLAEKVAANITLSAASGGMSSLLLARGAGEPNDLPLMLNGILAGLVSIAGPCAVVEPYAAVIIGILGGLVYYGAHHLLLKLKIDDPLDASAVHFFCGAWGLIAAGLFATEAGVTLGEFADSEHFGAFYGGGGEQLGVQCVGLAAIAGWTLVTSGILFAGLKTMGMLRLPPDEEISGLDHPSSGAIDFNAVMPTGGAK